MDPLAPAQKKVTVVNPPQKANRGGFSRALTASPYSGETLQKYKDSKLSTGHSLFVMLTKNTLRIVSSLGSASNLFLWAKKVITGDEESFLGNYKFLVPSTLTFGILPFLETLLTPNNTGKTSSIDAPENINLSEDPETIKKKIAQAVLLKIGERVTKTTANGSELFTKLIARTAYCDPIDPIREDYPVNELYAKNGLAVQEKSDCLYSWHKNERVQKAHELKDEDSICHITDQNGEKRVFGIRINLSDIESARLHGDQNLDIEILVKKSDNEDKEFKVYGVITNTSIDTLTETLDMNAQTKELIKILFLITDVSQSIAKAA